MFEYSGIQYTEHEAVFSLSFLFFLISKNNESWSSTIFNINSKSVIRIKKCVLKQIKYYIQSFTMIYLLLLNSWIKSFLIKIFRIVNFLKWILNIELRAVNIMVLNFYQIAHLLSKSSSPSIIPSHSIIIELNKLICCIKQLDHTIDSFHCPGTLPLQWYPWCCSYRMLFILFWSNSVSDLFILYMLLFIILTYHATNRLSCMFIGDIII